MPVCTTTSARGAVLPSEAHIVETIAFEHVGARHDERLALTGRDPHEHAFADEIATEARHIGVGHDLTAVELGVHLDDMSLRERLLIGTEAACADPHRIADFDETRMPLGHL